MILNLNWLARYLKITIKVDVQDYATKKRKYTIEKCEKERWGKGLPKF